MKEFRFLRAQNGGWVVFGVVPDSIPAPCVAAFTSTEHLVAGFADILQPIEQPTVGDVVMQSGDV